MVIVGRSTMMRGGWIAVLLLPSACSSELMDPASGARVPSTPPPAVVDPEPVVDGTGSPGRLRLLTRTEYDRTVEALLGDTTEPARSDVPPENQLHGFDNGEAHQASVTHIEAYQRVAVGVAERAVAAGVDLLVGDCVPSTNCGYDFIDDFGRRAFRRPLEQAEREAFRRLFDQVDTMDGFEAAVEVVVQAFLQSPQFLYRVETGPPADVATRLSPSAIATRLAYVHWSAPPDDALLQAAEDGALDTRAGVEAQVRRLVADPRAEAGFENFYAQVLETDGFASMSRDVQLYPMYSADLGLELRDSLHAFMDWVFREGGWAGMWSSDRVYATPRMAQLYDLPTPPGGVLDPVVGEPGRVHGLLTQPSLMALLAKPDRSGPIVRGVFVLERVLCRTLAPPPPGVPIVPPDPDPNATTRQRFEQHNTPECAECHQFIDPVGFAFENYDAMGRWRTTENGMPIDASGAVTLASDLALVGPVDGAAELAQRIEGAEEVATCMARQWFRFAMGRFESLDDEPLIEEMGQTLVETESFEEMMVALATSPSFSVRSPEESR